MGLTTPQNTESGKQEIEKNGDNSKLFIRSYLINARWNQITNVIQ